MDRIRTLSDEKRQQSLWLSDLRVKYGEISMTNSSLSSSCYSTSDSEASASVTDFEIADILLKDGRRQDANDILESETSWMSDRTNTSSVASSYDYYWSNSNSKTANTNTTSYSADGESSFDDDDDNESVLEAKTPVAMTMFKDFDRSCRSSTPPSRNVTPTVTTMINVKPPKPEEKRTMLPNSVQTQQHKWQESKQNLLSFGPSNFDSNRGVYEMPEVDTQSVSTVSGSGIDFFRKFVARRKGGQPGQDRSEVAEDRLGCKDCENQFRREVLIDRLVSDSLTSQANRNSSRTSSKASVTSSGNSSSLSSPNMSLANIQSNPERKTSPQNQLSRVSSSSSAGKCPAHQHDQSSRILMPAAINKQEKAAQSPKFDQESLRSSVSASTTVSGTGLLFLRNYLKKKQPPLKQTKNEDVSEITTTTTDQTLVNSKTSLTSPTPKLEQYQAPTVPPPQMVFNTVPIPFPPKNDFYGPAVFIPDDLVFCESEQSSRRNSFGSTIADLLNDTFDSEDSELKNLEWDWDEEESRNQATANDVIATLDNLDDTDIEPDDVSIIVDILDMAKPAQYSSLKRIPKPTTSAEDKPKIADASKKISMPMLDLSSPPLDVSGKGTSLSTGSCSSVTPTSFTRTTSRSSDASTPILPVQDQGSAYGELTASPRMKCNTLPSRPDGVPVALRKNCSLNTFNKLMTQDVNKAEHDLIMKMSAQQERKQSSSTLSNPGGSKKRLADFWEKRVSGNFDGYLPPSHQESITNHINVDATGSGRLSGLSLNDAGSSKFKPILPTYYEPEVNKKSNERLLKFLEATKKAADAKKFSTWSDNYDRLKMHEEDKHQRKRDF